METTDIETTSTLVDILVLALTAKKVVVVCRYKGYIHMHVYIYIYIYIHVYIERERERCVYIYIYICIY